MMLRTSLCWIALIALLLIPAGCKREAAHARVDVALVPLLPPDTIALACLRLDKLHDTPFYAKYVEGKKIAMLEKFANDTGLDIRKDIWELLVAMRPAGKPPLILIRGKFGGQFGLEPKFDKPGLQRMNYKGYNIIYADGPGVLFMNTGAAVAGTVDDLKLIVDSRDNPNWSTPKGLLELVGTLPGSAQFWIAAENGGALIPAEGPGGEASNYIRMLRSLGVATGYADLRNGVEIVSEAHYPDEQSSKHVHTALRGVLGMARLQTPDNQPDLLKLIDSTQITLDGRVVRLRLNAPTALVDRLISLLPESRLQGSSSHRPR